MGRLPAFLLVMSLVLVGCEPVQPPPEQEVASSVARPKIVDTFVPTEFQYVDENWPHGALALTSDQITRLSAFVMDRDTHGYFYRYLTILEIRNDDAEIRTFRQSLLERGDDWMFGAFCDWLLSLRGGEPGLVYGLAKDAHAAGFPLTLVMLGLVAAEESSGVDAFDRLRIGELISAMPDGSYESARALAHIYLVGAPELGIPMDPARAASMLESAATAGDGNQAYAIAEAFRRGEDVQPDYRRSQRLLMVAGDKGHPSAYNDSAWLIATCPGFSRADHVQALTHVSAHIAEYGESSMNVDTLAAVYARLGRRDDAVAAQNRAVELLLEGDPLNAAQRVDEFNERLNLYRAGRPYEWPEC